MKKHLLLLIPLSALVMTSPAPAGIRLVRFAEPCPKTFEEWVAYRHDFVNRYGVLGSKSIDSVGRWAEEQLKHFADCRKETPELFANNPGIDQCLSPVTHWLKALTPFRSNRTGPLYDDEDEEKIKTESPQKLGMNVPDAEYYKRTSQFTAIPEDITGNQEFLTQLNKPQNLPAVYAELEKINAARKEKGKPQLEWAQFKGNVAASGSSTLVRLMVYEPGNPAKWFSIGLPSDTGVRTPQWSAVAVHEKDGEKHIYFKDHWRRFTRDPNAAPDAKDAHYSTSFEDVKEGKFSDACWKCHKSGLLHLPVDPAMPEADRKQTVRFNQLMEETGLTGSAGFYDPKHLGPGLGGDPESEPGLAELREKLFPYCVADANKFGESKERKSLYEKTWKSVDKTKVLKAMNCSSCHDGVQRGKLTVPFGDILFRYIDENRMPMHVKLNDDEKKVLKACLDLEYSGMAADEERRRLADQEGFGTTSSNPNSKPDPWYDGIEGLPALKEKIIQGRFARQLLREPCTAKGKPGVPAPGPAHESTKATHKQGK